MVSEGSEWRCSGPLSQPQFCFPFPGNHHLCFHISHFTPTATAETLHRVVGGGTASLPLGKSSLGELVGICLARGRKVRSISNLHIALVRRLFWFFCPLGLHLGPFSMIPNREIDSISRFPSSQKSPFWTLFVHPSLAYCHRVVSSPLSLAAHSRIRTGPLDHSQTWPCVP